MLYKFRSKATGDLIMLGPHGDQLLRLLGREPSSKGIIEPAAMPAALEALAAAVAAEEQARRDAVDDEDGGADRGISLRRRVWPMVGMLKRALEAGEPIVWGV